MPLITSDKRNKSITMKLSLSRSASRGLILARRTLWLTLWFLIIPISLYSLWLDRGQSLAPLQTALMAIAIIGLIVVNLETVAVWYGRRQANTHTRGFLQHWFSRAELLPPGVSVTHVPADELPFVSVIVAAYLPNEQDIIVETLEHWLMQVEAPTAGWEVILAYNTPTRLPVEAQLQQLAQRFPALVLLPVAHSTSKAENLNVALQRVQGTMTCIFDADHRPARDCLMRAWAWLRYGDYDGVQGRNAIRNAQDNWLTRIIAVEFECIYGVSHYGRSLLADTALFGGSNGYWNTAAIRAVGFHPARLTEDIDATLRALLQGYRIVHDPNITTTELAPVTLRSLWLQRQRWSQGWMEVSGKYWCGVVRSPHLDQFQKTCWLIMLLYSLYFHTLIWQAIPISLSFALVDPGRDLGLETWNFVLMGVLILSMVVQVIVAIRPRSPGTPLSWGDGATFCLLSPLYFWFKSAIALVAFYNHLCGSRTWHVTQRTRVKSKPWAVGSRS